MARTTKFIAELTEGVVASIVDLTLLTVYIGFTLSTVRTMGDAINSTEEIYDFKERVNYQTIKQAIYRLTQSKLLKRPKKQNDIELSITKLGLKRIEALLPKYLIRRRWDGYIYLISYDIPTTHNHSRNLLREYIKLTGGALLQESLWINPYNPTTLLSTFAGSHDIPGTILVSKLGKDGSIGEEELPNLLRRVYKLDNLYERYEGFISKYEGVNKPPVTKLLFDYMTILKADPQLPFELLPKDFPAKYAYELVKPYLLKLAAKN